MPIKLENKKLYPDDWDEIRERIRNRADDKCEWCGVVNHSLINKFSRECCIRDEDDVIRVVCTIAHLDHDPENNTDNNLAFLCQKCHNSYDRKHRDQTIINNKLVGQLKLKL